MPPELKYPLLVELFERHLETGAADLVRARNMIAKLSDHNLEMVYFTCTHPELKKLAKEERAARAAEREELEEEEDFVPAPI